MQKAQGALEYLLLIGGAVLVAVIVITLILSISSTGGTQVDAQAKSAFDFITEQRELRTGGADLCSGGTPDEILDAGEQCDSSNLNEKTCVSQGFDGGTLSCDNNCRFDVGSCTGSCTPITICSAEQVCGSVSDGCGGQVNCGTCSGGQTCNASNQCVLACGPGHINNETTCTATLIASYDGYVTSNDDSTYPNPGFFDTETKIKISKLAEFGGYNNGFAEWDTAAIPDSAIINSVDFKYEATSDLVKAKINNFNNAKPSTTTTAEAKYDNASNGTIYVFLTFMPTFPAAGANQTISLGDSAKTELKNKLAADNFFAIGIRTEKPFFYDPGTGVSEISSEDNTTANPEPTLIVNYTPA
ncbi:MAG: class III signal peptide-containing protein [archaeon]|nr:class III signal peptide-containing protein [archaeon]